VWNLTVWKLRHNARMTRCFDSHIFDNRSNPVAIIAADVRRRTKFLVDLPMVATAQSLTARSRSA
jgi:hypothetical protein